MLEILLYPLSGFFMKISDDMHDKKNNRILGILAGILCGLFLGYLVTVNLDAAYIFFGVFIGTFLSKKVNCINHIITAIIFLIIVFLLGFPEIGIITLAICSIAAFIDEIGNDNEKIYAKSKMLETFFEYRFTLKTTIFVLAVFGLLSSFYPAFQVYGIHFMEIQTLIYFLMFEFAYEFAGLKFDAIYDRVYNIFESME
ncbi:hypothetical protein [Methanobacterium oryzae]|uniref:hypothetical protein n=1 Tax=Methanobacterium oryzae TaxID=69540 RepID=UPI003D20AAD0